MSDKDRLSGRFSFQKPVIFQAPIFGMAGGPGNSGFQGTGIQKTYSSGVNWNHVFTPTLLMEVRVGVAHYHNEATPSDYGSNDAQTLGVPNINVSQFTSGQVGVRLDSFTNGGGYGLTGYVNSLPWVRAEANIDLVNNWTKIQGNHTSGLVLTCGVCATICCRRKPTVRAACTALAPIKPPAREIARVSPAPAPIQHLVGEFDGQLLARFAASQQ
jgi:hypothetical protein